MDAEKRRTEIQKILKKEKRPVSASVLADRFSVSRQIIVGDIALLRASGENISATPRGYVFAQADRGMIKQIACRHSAGDMQRELYAIVDQGCTVIDVIVEHPVYGQITGPLQMTSRFDVEQFIEKCRANNAPPLSLLTDGIHLHTLSCPDAAAYDRVKKALREMDILIDK